MYCTLLASVDIFWEMFFRFFRHDFLDIHIASEVSVTPDVIQGESGRHTDLKAGFYQAKGEPVSRTLSRTRLVHVRPARPFDVSTKMWSAYDVMQRSFYVRCLYV